MKIIPFKLLIFTFFAISFEGQAQENSIPSIANSTSQADPYIFKAKTLEGRVKEAVEQGRAGDEQPIGDLLYIYSKQLDKVFAGLKKYLGDPDSSVQFILITAASYAPERPEALSILMSIAPDEDTGYEAVRTIYDLYNRAQILEKGKVQLKTALLRSAINSRYAVHAYLLLSCFKNEPGVLRFMQRRRASFKPAPPKANSKSVPRDTTRETISLDLALLELQDDDARQRIEKVFKENQTEKVTTLLQFLKFVQNKKVLLAATELLHNKTVSREVTSLEGKRVNYSRVCDDAMIALRARFDPSAPPVYDLPPRFSDAELMAAYKKYQTTIAALKPE